MDYSSDVDYLEFYECADVPCIDRKFIPPQVSDVSFTSDLSGLTKQKIIFVTSRK